MNNPKPLIKRKTTPMYFTLGQAAKEVGKSKGTLSNMIKGGALSVAEKTDRGYKIEAAELFRVFPNHNPKTVVNEQSKTPVANNLNTAKDREIALLRERLKDKDDVIEDLRKRLDKEGEERRNLTRVITDMREESKIKPSKGKKRFFGIIPYKND